MLAVNQCAEHVETTAVIIERVYFDAGDVIQ